MQYSRVCGAIRGHFGCFEFLGLTGSVKKQLSETNNVLVLINKVALIVL